MPSMAIYTVPETAGDMFPWLTQASSQWSVATSFFPYAQASLAAQRASFAAAQPTALVVEMQSVPHFLFLAQPDAVVTRVRSFLADP